MVCVCDVVDAIQLSMMQNLAVIAEMKVPTLYFKPQLRRSSTQDGTLAHYCCLQSAQHQTLLGELSIFHLSVVIQSDSFRREAVTKRLLTSLTDSIMADHWMKSHLRVEFVLRSIQSYYLGLQNQLSGSSIKTGVHWPIKLEICQTSQKVAGV